MRYKHRAVLSFLGYVALFTKKSCVSKHVVLKSSTLGYRNRTTDSAERF